MIKTHKNMTTRELSELLNISMSTIRHWKYEGLLEGCYSSSKKDYVYKANNYQFFWLKDKTKKRLEKIIELRECGSSIGDIKIELKI